ncbi:hypothetical protein MKW94_022375, partial [Papaver nudicaule]|nr:hypothetical protein [Papaver nudicaule]
SPEVNKSNYCEQKEQSGTPTGDNSAHGVEELRCEMNQLRLLIETFKQCACSDSSVDARGK